MISGEYMLPKVTGTEYKFMRELRYKLCSACGN